MFSISRAIQNFKSFISEFQYTHHSIGEAIFLGLALRQITSSHSALPFIDWHTDFFRDVILVSLSPILFILILFGRRAAHWSIITVMLMGILVCIFNYSKIKAFLPVSIIIGFYLLCTTNLHPSNKKLSARLCLFCIFVISALQKINPAYLSGNEFFKSSSQLLFHLKTTFPKSSLLDPFVQDLHLPLISIILELYLGFLFLISSTWASLLSLSFILALSAINPFVNYVFLLLAPLYLDLNSSIQNNLQKSFFGHLVRLPFFWLSFLVIWNSLPFYSASGYFFICMPFLLFLFIYTLQLHLPMPKNFFDFSFDFRTLSWRVLPPTGLICLYYSLSIFFLPNPAGFSMFSSRSFKHGWHSLKIESKDGCNWLATESEFSNISDVRFVPNTNTNCIIKAASIGSLTYARNIICQKDTSSLFLYTQSRNTRKKSLSCTSGDFRDE